MTGTRFFKKSIQIASVTTAGEPQEVELGGWVGSAGGRNDYLAKKKNPSHTFLWGKVLTRVWFLL